MKFMTVKETSEFLGLPISIIRNFCHMERCKSAIHKFDNSLTSPFYIDVEELLKIIRSGKADS